MGVVYRAFDRVLGREVALKMVRHATGRDLYRFKREFRLLADLVHPNLVGLHELYTDGNEWFFTMELVEGVPFIAWARPATTRLPTDHAFDPLQSTGSAMLHAGRHPSESPLREDRLRAALGQLADAVLALHATGKLHRDIKPSNVLVERDGTVKVLDFGLVADTDSIDRTHETAAAVGTPNYMSPEQAADRPLTEASDWYSVGVVLYEALTGRRPFEGAPPQVMKRKQTEVPAPPSTLAPDVPVDLESLCLHLLTPAAETRASGADVLAVLGRTASTATRDLERAMAPTPFVGRERELAALSTALADARDHCVAVFVRGESGIGKSHLLRQFLDCDASAVVLEGRCYERESVPHKALDTVVDALAAALLRLPPEVRRAVLPRDVATLQRLFPVLRRVPEIADRTVVAAFPPDPQELRRRAFGALRSLLRALAARAPVMIAIDDLQWGDADSAVFLSDLVHHPEPLPLLLVLVHRSDDELGIAHAVRQPDPGMVAGDVRTIDVAPLSDGEAHALARALGAAAGDEDALVRDTGGHPLYLTELARAPQSGAPGPQRLDRVIAARVTGLTASASALLRTATLAARPLPLENARIAAGIEQLGGEVAALRAERLMRVRRTGDGRVLVEPYHDRVRAAVLASMTADELRDRHEAMARTLEASPERDLEGLVVHWLGAGQPERAAAFAAGAAGSAERKLAFCRAADLYQLAAQHAGEGIVRRRLLRRRGEALASAGQLDAAAAAFTAAADGADEIESLDLERLRLEQVLRRGDLTEGLELAARVLARVGVTLPRSRGAALRGAIAERVRLRMRGFRFEARATADIPAATLRRLDALFAVASGLSIVDPLLGKLLQFRFLRESLDVGEPRRIAVAGAYEVSYLALGGASKRGAVEAASARLRALVDMLHDPSVDGLAGITRGLAAFVLGDWAPAREQLEAGLRILRDQCSGMRWEIDVGERFLIAALFYLGETRELAHIVPVMLRDAIERGDLHAQSGMHGSRSNVAWLVLGRPDEARMHALAAAPLSDPPDGAHLHHYYDLLAQGQIDLYEGDAACAWQRVLTSWPAIERARMARLQSVLIEANFLRARVILARLADAPSDARALRRELRKLTRQLGGLGSRWADAFACHLQAMQVREPDEAARRLEDVERSYAACSMRLHASAVRLRRGALLGGAAGALLVAEARKAMEGQAIVDAEAMARMMAPSPWPQA